MAEQFPPSSDMVEFVIHGGKVGLYCLVCGLDLPDCVGYLNEALVVWRNHCEEQTSTHGRTGTEASLTLRFNGTEQAGVEGGASTRGRWADAWTARRIKCMADSAAGSRRGTEFGMSKHKADPIPLRCRLGLYRWQSLDGGLVTRKQCQRCSTKALVAVRTGRTA